MRLKFEPSACYVVTPSAHIAAIGIINYIGKETFAPGVGGCNWKLLGAEANRSFCKIQKKI